MHKLTASLLLALLIPLTAVAELLVKESSGLAVGRDGVFWTHSDGPNIGAKVQDRNLYALQADGTLVRKARLDVRNDDWEDMASFTENGRPYLVVADVGDNLRRRSAAQLYVFREPRDEKIERPRKITFRYPDTPHDCEAVAVDQEKGQVLLITKRDDVPQIYAVPLYGSQRVETAVRLGVLRPLPKASLFEMMFHPLLAFFAHEPTSMDISPDNRSAVVLTYQRAYLWRRRADEPWEQALGREPDQAIAMPVIGQYEGVAFSTDGKAIHVSEEGRDTIQTFPVPQ